MPKSTNRQIKSGRNFITRQGRDLYDGPNLFKFASTNCDMLCLDIVTDWITTSDLVYPSKQRVDDWYAQAVALGCQVVRIYTAMPTLGSPMSCWPNSTAAQNLAPNEAAYKQIDYVVARAADYGLRLVIPLCDPYGYFVGCQFNPANSIFGTAGIGDWCTFFGGSGGDFCTNSTVINGFLSIVGYHLNRVNTYNGLKYCNDPTIMCWETGNELGPHGGNWSAYSAWVAQLCAYLKSQMPSDPNKQQLVMDGTYPVGYGAWNTASFTDPNVDCLSNHLYPLDTARLAADIATLANVAKAYLILEIDWDRERDGSLFDDWMAAVVANRNSIAGHGWWNLAAHADTYGWPPSANNYFNGGYPLTYDVLLGNPANEAAILKLRPAAYAFRGISPMPPYPVPGVPSLDLVGSALAWRGAAGASSYIVEKSTTSASSGFTALATGLTDFDTPWTDSSHSQTSWYRVRGVTPDGGVSHPSNAEQI